MEDLQEICTRCGVTPEGLLNAAMAADKDLTRRTLGFKHPHTPESVQGRRDNSKQLDNMWQAAVQAAAANLAPNSSYNPKDALLDQMVFVDEATIYLANLDAKSLHVFCSKQDISVRNVIHCPGLGKDKKVKVHFIAAVSLKHGPLYFNFTLGTRAGKNLFQGMTRCDWVRQPNDHPGLTNFTFPVEYKVSCCCVLPYAVPALRCMYTIMPCGGVHTMYVLGSTLRNSASKVRT
jgi:hypothetical protein